MNLDFNKLKNSLGKKLKFEANYIKEDKSFFKDVFYAVLIEVRENHIIVQQTYVVSNEEFKDVIISQKRKLIRGRFIINDEIP